MLGPSVFPSGEPGVSGDFWGSQEGCQGMLMGWGCGFGGWRQRHRRAPVEGGAGWGAGLSSEGTWGVAQQVNHPPTHWTPERQRDGCLSSGACGPEHH